MTRHLLIAALALTGLAGSAHAQGAGCTLTSGALLLEKPKSNATGPQFTGCITRSIDHISTAAVLSGGTTAYTFPAIYVSTIGGRSTGGIYFASSTYLSNVALTLTGASGNLVAGASVTASGFFGPLVGNVTGNADTATALAADPADAASGYVCRGINASGTCQTAAVDDTPANASTSPVTSNALYDADVALRLLIPSTAAYTAADDALKLLFPSSASVTAQVDAVKLLFPSTASVQAMDDAVKLLITSTSTWQAQTISTVAYQGYTDAHTMSRSTHDATDAATASRMVVRDSGGGAAFSQVTAGTMTATGNAFSVGVSTLMVTSGMIGIGTTSPTHALTVGAGGEVMVVDGAIKSNGSFYFDVDDDNNGTNLFYFRNGTDGNVMSILENGQVGIGTTAPDSGTTVEIVPHAANKGLAVRTSDNSTNVFTVSAGAADGSMALGKDGASNTVLLRSDGVSYFNAGSVGIGTANPSSKLHVSSSSIIVDGTGAGLNVVGPSTATYFYGTGANFTGNAFSVGVSTLVATGGKVGVGTASPAVKLHISTGGIIVDGNADTASVYVSSIIYSAKDVCISGKCLSQAGTGGGDVTAAGANAFAGNNTHAGTETFNSSVTAKGYKDFTGGAPLFSVHFATGASASPSRAYCPDGYYALGGGCACESGDYYYGNPITASGAQPVLGDGGYATGFACRANTTNCASYVQCFKFTPSP